MKVHSVEQFLIFKKNTPDNVPLSRTRFREHHVEHWLPTPERNEDFIEHYYFGKVYGASGIKDFITCSTQVLESHITTIILDPDPKNEAAIKCYETTGFQRVCLVKAPWGGHSLCDLM